MTPKENAWKIYNDMLFNQKASAGAPRRAVDCALLLINAVIEAIEQQTVPSDWYWRYWTDTKAELEKAKEGAEKVSADRF